jgi:signal recognition particle receptor subunit beta
MPHIDGRSGEIVIRVVYDGPPEAGKTTNVRQLTNLVSLQRRGASKSPGTGGARTEFFDWVDFSGGYLDGRKVRCQIVSVPGQVELLHRRRYLLETADAIVFVSDSRSELFGESGRSLAATLKILDRFAGHVPVGVVLQANKQDLPGALAPADVGTGIGLPGYAKVVGSVAARGEGVMETFVLAVRLATDRVRALLTEQPLAELPPGERDPDVLHAAMLEREPPPREGPRSAPPPAAEGARLERVPKATRPGRTNRMGEQRPALPRASDIASGHVWPPVKGRAAIAVATSSDLVAPDVVQAWAPADAVELVSANGWILHSSTRWLFGDEAQARHRLHTIVRALVTRPDSIPDGRALAVAPDGQSYRLWLVTPRIPSIAESVLAALEARNLPAVSTAVREAAAAVRQGRAQGSLARDLPAGISGLAVGNGRLVVLSLCAEDDARTPGAAEPLADLAELLDEWTTGDGELRPWVETKGRDLLREGSTEPNAA